MDNHMENRGSRIGAHIRIALIIGCIALVAVSFLVRGIPTIPAPSAGILGLSVAGENTLSLLSSVTSQLTTSQQFLLLLYFIAAVIVAYCLVGLIGAGLSYLRDPSLYHITSYVRKGAYHGYAPQDIARRLREQGWDKKKVKKAVEEVFRRK